MSRPADSLFGLVPIYEYRCPNGHVFELFQRMSDAPPDVCVECGTGPVERVLYPVAVHFKGSGFYSTDYGKGSRKKKEAASTDSGSGSGSDSGGDSGESKTEKKPAEA
jgi:putative FmdB family regulatory protein